MERARKQEESRLNMAGRLNQTMRGEKGRKGKRGDAERWLWPTGQETSLAEMPKLHRDQAAGRETETQPLGGEV